MSITFTAQQCQDDNDNDNEDPTSQGESHLNTREDFNEKLSPKPEDLRISDRLNKQTHQSVIDKCLAENSSNILPSWKHLEGAVDEDVYTITADDRTMPNSTLQITSIDGFFNRKRGRPPKNRFVEVYKNTQQKPQAIFTSFKLEKQSVAALVEHCGNSSIHCLQSNVEIVRDCDSNNKQLTKYSRHKPTHGNTNSRHSKGFSSMSAILPTHSASCFKTLPATASDEDSQNPIVEIMNVKGKDEEVEQQNDVSHNPRKCFGNLHNGCNETPKPFSGPAFKKSRPCGTATNVTVIRAAGTFYPEYLRENSKDEATPWSKDQRKNLSYRNDAEKNLSLKASKGTNARECLESSIFGETMSAEGATVLPQIYSVIQMQQQLLALYQRMTLMTASFSYLTPTSGDTSTKVSEGSAMDLFSDKHLPNCQKRAGSKQKDTDELIIGTRAVQSSVPERHQRTKKRKTSNKINNGSENIVGRLAVYPKIKEAAEYQATSAPLGYVRFRYSEDCGYMKCSYRQHQSHFHCNRTDCHYSFCDKTRFVQHTARHERLDILMGGDFEQYRASMSCNYINCPFVFGSRDGFKVMPNTRKSYHFHCTKCPFVCADTSKVVAHRHLHNKIEFLRLAGFRKVTSNEDCKVSNNDSHSSQCQESIKPFDAACSQPLSVTQLPCPYAKRHAHYHCLVCNWSVLSKSQLLNHKHQRSPSPGKLALKNLLSKNS